MNFGIEVNLSTGELKGRKRVGKEAVRIVDDTTGLTQGTPSVYTLSKLPLSVEKPFFNSNFFFHKHCYCC